ncbi:MAG TPA: cation diffusion facilitator family transporter [Blastocatellia bacterium]|jgi:ferrous-iron efflux pump FieF|nr:cation diffusion facilitator family transporter [Blastocatellia bacterium]
MKGVEAGEQVHLAEVEEAAAKNSVARLSILAAAFLVALKTVTGLMTGSISVWASLLDSTMDIFASTINFIAVRVASRPADEDHSYGHGKAESLAGLFQAAVITASGIFLIWEAVRRLRQPHEVRSEWAGITTMMIAIAVSAGLVVRLRSIARKTESPALSSDAIHYASDIYTNSGALLALLIIKLSGFKVVDPLISILISLYILWSAASVARESVDVLMDRRLPAEVDEQIANIVGRYREYGIFGFHDLRTRRSGSHKFIDLHLEVAGDKSLEEAHDLTVRVLREIESEIPRSHVQIHTDPI